MSLIDSQAHQLLTHGALRYDFVEERGFLGQKTGGSSRSRTDLHGFANTGPTPIGHLETKGRMALAPSRAKT